MTVLLRVLLLLLTALIANGDGVNLTFMLVTSYGGTGRYNSSGTLPAAEIALREINSRPDILPGYNLVYDKVRNSAVRLPCWWECREDILCFQACGSKNAMNIVFS